MRITAYKSPLVGVGDDLWQILAATLPDKLEEHCVVAVTSKIVSLCQGRAEKIPSDGKKARARKVELTKAEADQWILGSETYQVYLTLKNHCLVPTSGIDESNSGGYFLLWPEDVQRVAEEIWRWLRKKYGVKEVGVIITDSHTIMLKWGVVGMALAWCGFVGVRSKIGDKDLFNHEFVMTKINDAESLAMAAVYEMGETNEQTPVAVVSELKEVIWQTRVPDAAELQESYIEPTDDLYGKLIGGVKWEPGGGGV